MGMKRKYLIFHLLFLISGGFVAAALGVFLFADGQVKKVVNQSQNMVYDEKLDAIIRILEASVDKLNATGLRDAYEMDFQQSALGTLRSVYYTGGSQRVYPAILTGQGEIVMHPVLPPKDRSIQNTPYVQNIIRLRNGGMNYIYETNEEKWCRFKSFETWNWIVVFVVPLEIKHADVRLLRKRLSLTLAGVVLLVMLVLSMVISNAVKPISVLTRASEAMAAGDLSLSVDIDRADEVGMLAKSFVSMRNSIQEKIRALAERNRALNREISQRKQAELKLAASEKRLDTIIKTVPDIIYRLDTDGKITFISDAVRKYGYTPDTLLGTSVIDLVHQEDKEKAKDRITERRTRDRSTTAFEVRLLTKDQQQISFEIFSVSAEGLYASRSPIQSTFLGTQGIARDITERKKAEIDREKLIVDLQDALENVNTLSGLVPICANCKKIRDDKGYWNQIEGYIQKYSEVKFSHGMCPECSDQLYGDTDWYKKMKQKKKNR